MQYLKLDNEIYKLVFYDTDHDSIIKTSNFDITFSDNVVRLVNTSNIEYTFNVNQEIYIWKGIVVDNKEYIDNYLKKSVCHMSFMVLFFISLFIVTILFLK